jgi:hypothetical protein
VTKVLNHHTLVGIYFSGAYFFNKLHIILQDSHGSGKASLTPEQVCPFPRHRGRKEEKFLS